ncbi:MAG: glucose-1-phosphate thymidylyltransferase, partial [Methanoregula sp.]
LIETDNAGILESGTITGAVKIGKNTFIRDNSIITGPVVIGKDCIISGSTIGPFTSIGDTSHITASHISNSIVMEGGIIDHVDSMSDSLIGKNVILKKQDPAKQGKSFVLGDGSQVFL